MSAEMENRLRAAFEARTEPVTPDVLTKPATLEQALDLGPTAQDVHFLVVDDLAARRSRRRPWMAPLLAAATVAALLAGGYAVASSLVADKSNAPATDAPTPTDSSTPTATPTTSLSPLPTAPPTSPTDVAPAPLVQAVTAASLESAPVPALCRHEAATLVDGVQPDIPQGNGEGKLVSKPASGGVASRLIALGDLTGDGVGDAAAIFNCDGGGVPWPDHLLFYTAGPKLLGSVFLGDYVGDARYATESITYRDGGIDIATRAGTPAEGGCCVFESATLRFTWNGHSIVASNIAFRGPDVVDFKGVGDVRLGQTAAQLEVERFGAGQSLADGCTEYQRASGLDSPGAETALVATVDPATGKVIAIDMALHARSFVSAAGISVDSTTADVLAAYKGHTIEQHLAGDFGQGSSGILVEGDGGWIGFTIKDGKVSGIKVGDKAHATNGEAGC